MGILQDYRREWKRGRVRLPNSIDFLKEYDLIMEKKSTLSSSQRKAVIVQVENMRKTPQLVENE